MAYYPFSQLNLFVVLFPAARTFIWTQEGFSPWIDSDHWEPNAASIADRIGAIKTAHEKGIKTWVSMEPVIDPAQAIALVKALNPVVNHWKVGKLNYNKGVCDKVDWPGFKADITSILDGLGADYYLKNSLRNL